MPLLIGTSPNQVPTNADLGSMAFQDAESVNIKSGYVAGLPSMRVVVTGTTVTASAGQHLILTNAGATTVTLPSTPNALDTIQITVANDRVDNIVSRNSKTIDGYANDLTIPSKNSSFTLTYVDDTIQWRTGNTGLNAPQKQVYNIGQSTLFTSNYNSMDNFGQYLLCAANNQGTVTVQLNRVNANGSISFGTAQTFSAPNVADYRLAVFMLSETVGCIVYPHLSTWYIELRSIALNTSNLTITVNSSPSSLGNIVFKGVTQGVKLTSQRLLLAYADDSGYLRLTGISLNADGTAAAAYTLDTVSSAATTVYSISSTQAIIFDTVGNQSLITFSGSATPTVIGVNGAVTGIPMSKYHVSDTYYQLLYSTTSPLMGQTNAKTSTVGTFSGNLPSSLYSFPGSLNAYADDKVMIYVVGGVTYYCPLYLASYISPVAYLPTGEHIPVVGSGNIETSVTMVGRQSVGGGKFGCAIDIGAVRYYILSPASGGVRVYIYAYK